MALIKCQHTWFQWLDKKASSVRILSFDFSKAFDAVTHNIVSNKLKALRINPFLHNWIISFLSGRLQRVKVDGMETDYLPINKGIPQGAILGPIIFSVMVNGILALHPSQNVFVKYADDLTLSIPVGDGYDDNSDGEVQNIAEWADNNRLDKTWEMVLNGKSSKPLPDPIQEIKRRDWLKLLGVTFQDKPCDWDKHFQYMISKACGRLYILRACKFYGYSKEDLHLLFNSLIMSVFYFAIEVHCGHMIPSTLAKLTISFVERTSLDTQVSSTR